MTSVNYTGRTIDLLMFQGTQVTGDAKVTIELAGAGEVTTGIQKLVQKFTNLFLTERGSMRYQPTLGTDFVTTMRRGLMRDEADVRSNFALAVELVRQTLALVAEQNSLPEDETFDTATLLDFNLDTPRSNLFLRVQVVSAAGEDRVVYLPVPAAIQ